MKNNHGDRIPMDYPVIILMVGVMLPLCVFFFYHWEHLDFSMKIMLPAAVALVLYGLWDASESYTLDETGMKCYKLGKLTREIPWDQISQIGITTRQDGMKGSSQRFILIVMKGCRLYNPYIDRAYEYCSNHKGSVIQINYIKRNAPLFEKYYGPMDFDITGHKW